MACKPGQLSRDAPLVFGAIRCFFKELDYPVAPLVLAIVLGDRAEVAFRQSMLMGGGSLAVFWGNGISATFSTLAVFIAGYPLYAAWRDRRRQAAQIAR